MYTINKEYKNELIIKNSRFITIFKPFNDNDDLSKVLDKVKEEYPEATHYTYAYITKTKEKAYDDNEPSKTAGMPILIVLKKQELVNVIAIVIRYFGGIKLGANGLIRAYAKGISNLIKEATLHNLVKGYNVKITINYEDTNQIDYLLKDTTVNSKNYLDKVIYDMMRQNYQGGFLCILSEK